MKAVLEAVAGASATSLNVQFVAYLLIGMCVGWLLTRPCRWNSWCTSLALVGVCGAWLGAEVAHLFGQAESGSAHQFVAALIGAGALAYFWRRLHPRPDEGDVAIRQSDA